MGRNTAERGGKDRRKIERRVRRYVRRGKAS